MNILSSSAGKSTCRKEHIPRTKMSNSYEDKLLQGHRLAIIRNMRLVSKRMLLEFGTDLLHAPRAPTSKFETFTNGGGEKCCEKIHDRTKAR